MVLISFKKRLRAGKVMSEKLERNFSTSGGRDIKRRLKTRLSSEYSNQNLLLVYPFLHIFSWKDCLRFYVDREREKRLNAARQVSNTVMEQNKQKEGALVRIGDLHTGRRFEAKKLMAKTPLPPLELRVRDPGEPKVIRLALKHNKILLAPMGRFWAETRETQSMMELAAKRRAQRKSEVDIITAQFQKFFCPENSYVHHTASDIY